MLLNEADEASLPLCGTPTLVLSLVSMLSVVEEGLCDHPLHSIGLVPVFVDPCLSTLVISFLKAIAERVVVNVLKAVEDGRPVLVRANAVLLDEIKHIGLAVSPSMALVVFADCIHIGIREVLHVIHFYLPFYVSSKAEWGIHSLLPLNGAYYTIFSVAVQ